MTSPIRIVPLKSPALAAPPAPAAAPPRLTYRNGPLIAAPAVSIAFWGSAWRTQSDLQQLIVDLSGFFTAAVATGPGGLGLIELLQEYSVPAYRIGAGRFVGSTVFPTESPVTLADADIQAWLAARLGAGDLPPATSDSLYFVFTAPGVTVNLGADASCTTFCGYHDVTPSGVYYAVVPHPDCNGCVGGLSVLDAMTSVSSHELSEAITDAVPGQGWYDDANGEIGDICSWQNQQVGAYMLQTEWSNAQGACVAPTPPVA